ncbi:hypothetical protein [Rudaeicoccus suwonensis]|uniref:hypothetical protein n=1 Tax=Rudaeicoccus suwonensis TaxID=657409 RepID=UPI0011A063E9|nr:hypothetical protein [Rudaeicoccus suwonensis]
MAATGGSELQRAVEEKWNLARVPMVSVRTVFSQHPAGPDDAPSVALFICDSTGECEVLLRAHEARALIDAIGVQLQRISSITLSTPTN